MFTVEQAQRNSARLYLRYARLAPRNSGERKEWVRLARTALQVARHWSKDNADWEAQEAANNLLASDVVNGMFKGV